MYSLKITYTWSANGRDAFLSGQDLEGPGFGGYDDIEDAVKAYRRWLNRQAGRVIVHRLLIEEERS